MLNMDIHCTEHNVDSWVHLLPLPRHHWHLCSLYVCVCNSLCI